MTLPGSELSKLLDGVYECRDGQCRQVGVGYKLLPSAKFSSQQFGLDVAFSDSLDIDERKMSVRFPFADGMNRDGVGDLLEVEGIDLSRHRKLPNVLFDHGKQVTLPIGFAAEYDEDSQRYDIDKYTVEIDPILRVAHVTAYFYRGKGMSGVERAREHEHGLFCEQLFDMMAKGLVRAGSIGYQVVDARELPPDYRTGTPKGLHLLKTLMLEASAVVLPANGDTVRKMLDMPKSCGKPLSPWLIKSLKPYAPERKAFMATGEQEEKAFNMAKKEDFEAAKKAAFKAGKECDSSGGFSGGLGMQPDAGSPGAAFDAWMRENITNGSNVERNLLQKEFGRGYQQRKKKSLDETEEKALPINKDTARRLLQRLRPGESNILQGTLKISRTRPNGDARFNQDDGYFVDGNDYPMGLEAAAQKISELTSGGKSYSDNFLESRDDYENPLSDSDVPNARWKPGLGAVKSVDERGGQFWVVFADGTERGPFGSEEDAMAIHRQPDLSAKSQPSDKIPGPKACEILRDGTVHGEPLTDAQRGMFGAACSEAKTLRKKYRGKAMSAQTETTGGALRKPPQQGQKAIPDEDHKNVVAGELKPKDRINENGKIVERIEWWQPYGAMTREEEQFKKKYNGWTRVWFTDGSFKTYGTRQKISIIRWVGAGPRPAHLGGKSLDAMTLRKQYRSPVRRRLRKSIPGAASMHVAEKDMDAARRLAGEKGVKFERLGETKVKLIGPDEAIDEVAKAFGRRVKAMAIGTKAREIRVRVIPHLTTPGKFGIYDVAHGWELQNAPDSFNSEQDARKWAETHGYKVEKSMSKVKTKVLPEEIEEDKDMGNPYKDEPFGSQSLRHYRQKLMDDMAETEGHIKLLDHEPTKKLLTKMQEHRADMLDEIDSTHAKHYKDLPQFEAQVDPEKGEDELEEVAEAKEFDPMDDDDAIPADSDVEEEPTPEEVIEGMERAEEDDPDVREVKALNHQTKMRGFQIGDRVILIHDPHRVRPDGTEGTIVELNVDGEPDWVGVKWKDGRIDYLRYNVLKRKGLKAISNVKTKALPDEKEDKEEKKHMCGKCAKAMKTKAKKKGDGNKFGPRYQGALDWCDTHDIEGDCEEIAAAIAHGPKSFRSFMKKHFKDMPDNLDEDDKDYPIDTPVPEQAIEDAELPDSAKDYDLADHEKKGIGEAGDYLNDMSQPGSIHDDESRHKAYHYAKTLEGIGQVEAHAKESEAAAVEDAEHDIGEGGNKSQIPGDLDYWQEEANEPEHVKMCKGAAGFLKQISMRKDFGDVHREQAKSWHKRLKDLIETGEPLGSEEADELAEETGLPTPEMSASKTYEPGEMGEKDTDEENKEDKRMKRNIKAQKDSPEEKRAYEYARRSQGFTGTYQDWLKLPPDEREEYEDGAQGKALKRKSADDEKKDKEDKRMKKAAEPKEEDLKALAQSTQRNKSVLANLNRTLASLNGMI